MDRKEEKKMTQYGRKSMKRLSGLLALLLVLALLLCGCKGNGPISDEPTGIQTTGAGDVTTAGSTPTHTSTTPGELPALTGAVVREDGNGCTVRVCSNATETQYETYGSALQGNGFVQHTENRIGFNRFSTWYSDDIVVNLIFSSYNSTFRVITEPKTSGALPATETQTASVCTPLAISVGLAPDTETTHKNGLCYIFRLTDGSFVIYDGGWDHTVNRMSEKIMAVLQKEAPDPQNIVISLWVITHAHTDHVGGFNQFIREHRNDVTIRSILLNTPSDTFCTQTSMTDKVAYFKSTLNMCRGADRIIAHPGQKLQLPDATLEVLYTMDLYDAQTLDEYNTASVVTRLTIGGQSFLMTGDMTETSNQVLQDMYGSRLQSNFVQVAHHGYVGGTAAFYNRVNADYVLWPASLVGYNEMKNKARNQNFKNLSDKRLIVAQDYITRIPLPYGGGGVTRQTLAEYCEAT